jgi:MFS family permease
MLGLITLAGATVMLHLGRSVTLMIIGRIAQGGSASVVWIVGLSMLADTIPPEEIGQAMGYVFTAMSLGMLLGPLLAGIIFDKAGYDAVFGLAYGVIAIDVLMRLLVIEKKVAARWKEEDTPQTDEQVVWPSTPIGDGDMDIELVHRQNARRAEPKKSENDSERSELDLIESPIRRRKAPAIVTLLKSKRLLAACWATVATGILMTSIESTMPLYVKSIWSWTSTGAGKSFRQHCPSMID